MDGFYSELLEKFSHRVRIMIGSFGRTYKKLGRRIWKEKVSVVLWHGIKKQISIQGGVVRKICWNPCYPFSVALHRIFLPVSPLFLLQASLSLQFGWGKVREHVPSHWGQFLILTLSEIYFLWIFSSFRAFFRHLSLEVLFFSTTLLSSVYPFVVKSWSVTWKWSHQDYFKGQNFGAEEK